ncbi:MAG TPA: VWA domain-containing protein [Pyrinomonadaceae bacterium]|nr:VWA domain-containing protein [Pyrinomonadaceae bacterium]
MRKTATVSLLLSLLLFPVLSLQAQTRQRRVGQVSPGTAQPESPQPEPAPSNRKRPVLQTGTTISNGNRTPSQQQSSAQTQTSDDPEEVGENDVVRVDTTLVTIPVSVMDRNGRFIPDLRQQEFRIYEDGVEHEVAYFAAVEKPFTLALVLDTSASTRFHMEEIQDAAIAFINQLRPDDRVLIVSFDEEVRVLAEATNNRNVLRDAIRRTRTGGNTKLYDAVDLVINQRLNREQGRKAVVLFTDGVDTASTHASYQSNVRDAEELDALIYPVQYDTYNDTGGGWGGGGGGGGNGGGNWPSQKRKPRSATGILIDILGDVLSGNNGGGGGGNNGPVIFGGGNPNGSPDDYRRANSYLNDLAYKTGARVFRADNTRDLEQSFANIAEELRRQYSLGYYPKATAQAGTRRQIRVRVMRPNLVVRARDSYITGSQPSGATTAQGNTQQSKPELRKRQLAESR